VDAASLLKRWTFDHAALVVAQHLVESFQRAVMHVRRRATDLAQRAS
jgi:hypothetical protein